MTMIRESDTYTATMGGTALWSLDPTRVNPNTKHEKLTTKKWSGRIVETSEPVVFFDIIPSVRTSPPPNHPQWDKVDALLAEAQKGYIPSVEEDNEWLNELRSGWGTRLEIFDNESD